MLGVGTLLSLALFFMIRAWEKRDLEKKAADLTREQVEKLRVGMLRSMEVLHSIASFYSAQDDFSRQQFRQFVRQALARQPEVQALSWNPLVPGAERRSWETAAVADGIAGFGFRELNTSSELVPAKTRSEYVPVYFIEPFSGNAAALGYDLSSDPCRRASLEKARDSAEAVATAPIHLAQDHNNQAGFLVLLPVYNGAAANVSERRQKLAGFAVAVFRVTDLVGGTFEKLKKQGIAAQLFDESPARDLLFSNDTTTNVHSRPNARPPIPLEAVSRRWEVVYEPMPAFLSTQSHAHSWLALLGGFAITLLATAYLYSGWKRTKEIAAANTALQEEVAVRQRAEAAAEAANHAKSDFLASMSHEIRTPLNAILGYSQLMQRDLQLSAEQRDAIGGISTAGQHLLGLINEILDLSKIEAGRMELNPGDFDLAALGRGVAATFQPLCAQKRINFRLMLGDAGKSPVQGDEGKLRQVLINLLGNAVKFTQAGEVCLQVKPEADDRWLFEVFDTGLGIPEEEQADIFNPFHQGSNAQHQGGTGLGLAIAKRQVELLGGKLAVQSERGIGSRFFFQIPLPPAIAVEELETVTLIEERLKPGCLVRALVVDDRKENRDILGHMLARVGCEVLLAGSGSEALRLARGQKPQMVFMDLLMPELDGIATARALLSDPAGMQPKIVAHSASALARFRDQAREAGCVDFIAKPIRSEQVYECLRIHLGAEFEYASQSPLAETLPAWETGRLSLPRGLYARLATAAELHSTTALKASLQDLRQLSPEARQLAEHIRHLMRSYDMDGILELIFKVAVPIDEVREAVL